jgi:serine/threonine protein kinase
MSSLAAELLSASEETPPTEELLEQFEGLWRRGTTSILADFLAKFPNDNASHSAQTRALLEELVKIDLEYRWRQLQETGAEGVAAPPLLEDYAGQHAELGPAAAFSQELIGEEYRVRQRWGDQPDHAEYVARFPGRGVQLLEHLRAIDTELKSDYASAGRPETEADICPADAPTAELVQPLTSTAALRGALRHWQLLTDWQFDELRDKIAPQFPELRSLARQLLVRDWLTPYQVNLLMLGRGAELILEPYVLLERLGEGATGWVFKARHRLMKRLVALKVLRGELMTDPELLARFYQEIQVVSQLSHPHVVHAYDAGPIGGRHVLAMEYAEGTDLAALVKRSGPLPVEQARDFIRQAALGLQHIHERGLIHRDIKPSNLMLCGRVEEWKRESAPALPRSHSPTLSHSHVRILDLGLARLGQAARRLGKRSVAKDGTSSRLTPVGAALVGTPDYMAPEQALDFQRADARSDIYSLGCTSFYLLTARPPFPGGTFADKLIRHQDAEAPRLDRVCADVPAALASVVAKMLAKDPTDRFQNAAELLHALQTPEGATGSSSASGERASSRSDPVPPLADKLPVAPWRRRLTSVAFTLLVFGAGVVVGGWMFGGSKTPVSRPVAQRPAVIVPPSAPRLDFAQGFSNASRLTLNGSASVTEGRLRLTDGKTNEAGSAFASGRWRVNRFAAEFTFQLSKAEADGFTFTIQGIGPTALGASGGGLGYGPDPNASASSSRISKSVALKFDLYDNKGEGSNSTGLFVNGAAPALPAIDMAGTGIDLHSGHRFHVTLLYDAGLLHVTILDLETQASASQEYRIDIPGTVGGTSAYVGFTGGTGGLTATQDILSWQFSPLP